MVKDEIKKGLSDILKNSYVERQNTLEKDEKALTDDIAEIFSIHRQLRLFISGPNLENKTNVQVPSIPSDKQSALENILNFKIKGHSNAEKDIRETIQFLNSKIEEKMKNG